MAGDVKIALKGNERLRNEAGRFRRADPGKALDRMMVSWAQQAVASLREATPVEQGEIGRQHPASGTAREAWRWQHRPGQHLIDITNTAVDERDTPYLRFHVTGTGQETGGYIYPAHLPGWLVFYAKEGGKTIARRRVRGIQPNPQLVAAIERLGPLLETMTHDLGIEILKEVSTLGGGES